VLPVRIRDFSLPEAVLDLWQFSDGVFLTAARPLPAPSRPFWGLAPIPD